jgi:hypothetical protein
LNFDYSSISVSSVAKSERMSFKRLIIFTRYPEPGRTKTRLIPALGPEGAADLHRQMTEHTLTWSRQLKNHSGVSLEVHYEGGDELQIRQWLGCEIPCCPQGKGDLGARMVQAFDDAFSAGMGRVIIIGTDCPGLTGGLARTAFEALMENDVVLGPAKDGGYYLIGLRKPIPQLFEGIPWGTSEVLARTSGIAADLNLQAFLLEPLDDVDRPEDLGVWEKVKCLKCLECAKVPKVKEKGK